MPQANSKPIDIISIAKQIIKCVIGLHSNRIESLSCGRHRTISDGRHNNICRYKFRLLIKSCTNYVHPRRGIWRKWSDNAALMGLSVCLSGLNGPNWMEFLANWIHSRKGADVLFVCVSFDDAARIQWWTTSGMLNPSEPTPHALVCHVSLTHSHSSFPKSNKHRNWGFCQTDPYFELPLKFEMKTNWKIFAECKRFAFVCNVRLAPAPAEVMKCLLWLNYVFMSIRFDSIWFGLVMILHAKWKPFA